MSFPTIPLPKFTGVIPDNKILSGTHGELNMTHAEIWTTLKILNWTKDYLTGKGIANARLEAEWMLCAATGLDRVGLYLNFDKPLNETELAAYRDMVSRRGRREPRRRRRHHPARIQVGDADRRLASRMSSQGRCAEPAPAGVAPGAAASSGSPLFGGRAFAGSVFAGRTFAPASGLRADFPLSVSRFIDAGSRNRA